MKYLNEIVQGDCIELLQELPVASVQLIFADPPFNIGKEYKSGIDDNLPLKEYQEWTFRWIDACIRVLRYSGTFVIHHIPKHALWIGNYLLDKLEFQEMVAWKERSWPTPYKLSSEHYTFLVFSEDGSKFNPWADPIPHATCPHCKKQLKHWGGKEKNKNPLGTRPSDIWTDISRVRHRKHKNRQDANELPEKITNRFILTYTDENDIIFDPFVGSGTTAVSAKKLGRNFIGFELSEEYCQIARQRLIDTKPDKG